LKKSKINSDLLFTKATFNQNRAERFISLLGFNHEVLERRRSEYVSNPHPSHSEQSELANHVSSRLSLNGSSSVFDHHGDQHTTNGGTKQRLKSLSQANDEEDTFSDIARSMSPVNLSFENDIDSLTSELLILGQYEKVVDLLIKEHRFTDAILIANFFDKNLYAKAQQAYFRHNAKNKFSNVNRKVSILPKI
jgi:protein transport protein SEC31